jgi:hypothetical protein
MIDNNHYNNRNHSSDKTQNSIKVEPCCVMVREWLTIIIIITATSGTTRLTRLKAQLK